MLIEIGVYISVLPNKNIDDDFIVLINQEVVPRHTVSSDDKVLKIDLENAWKELKLLPHWSNEVSVEIFMAW
jgi:hypothetical protein